MANDIIGYLWDPSTYTGAPPAPSGWQDASHVEIPAPPFSGLYQTPHVTTDIPGPVPDHLTLDLSPVMSLDDYIVTIPDFDPITGHVYGEWSGGFILATQTDPKPVILNPDAQHLWNSNQNFFNISEINGHHGCWVMVRYTILRADRATPADCMGTPIATATGLYDGTGAAIPDINTAIDSGALPPLQMPAGDYDLAVPANIVSDGAGYKSLLFDKNFIGPTVTLPLSSDAAWLDATITLGGVTTLHDPNKVPIFRLADQPLPAPPGWPYEDPGVQNGQPKIGSVRLH